MCISQENAEAFQVKHFGVFKKHFGLFKKDGGLSEKDGYVYKNPVAGKKGGGRTPATRFLLN